jgi:vacuolar-type H+-ATPase subunit E/Vma4
MKLFSLFKSPSLTEEISAALDQYRRKLLQAELQVIEMSHTTQMLEAKISHLQNVSQGPEDK